MAQGSRMSRTSEFAPWWRPPSRPSELDETQPAFDVDGLYDALRLAASMWPDDVSTIPGEARAAYLETRLRFLAVMGDVGLMKTLFNRPHE